MKKILIFCVVLAMLLFAGCNGDPKPTEPTAPETEVDTTNLTYAQFHELTGIQQQEIMESFESIEAFFLWYDQAKAEHEKENPPSRLKMVR